MDVEALVDDALMYSHPEIVDQEDLLLIELSLLSSGICNIVDLINAEFQPNIINNDYEFVSKRLLPAPSCCIM